MGGVRSLSDEPVLKDEILDPDSKRKRDEKDRYEIFIQEKRNFTKEKKNQF